MGSQQSVPGAAEILEPLTSAQRDAVCHLDGPLLILAGPGSGKTRVVTHRVAYLLSQGVPARQVLALTFTNKAADEMKLRLDRLIPGQTVWLGTFHRFCAQLLRRYAESAGLSANFSIYDADDSRSMIKRALASVSLELSHVTPDQVAREISHAKNNLITADLYAPRPGHPLGALASEVYPAYQRRMLAANAVDFDDLLLHVATLLRDNPDLRALLDERYRYVLVDEYQDTNFAQYAIVRALSQDHPNLAVTGDPDQSIYGWRGANLNNILDFEKDFPDVRVVRLEQNYRSTPGILRIADQLIQHNSRRKRKTLFSERPEGPPVRLVTYPTGRDEAEHIAGRIAGAIHSGQRRPKDFAIFYRVNALSRAIESALRAAGVPYQVVRGLEFYQRKEVKDVLAYLHLLNNPQNDVALLRIINTPPRMIGAKTVGHLRRHAELHQLTLLEAARQAGLIEALTTRAATRVAAFVALVDRLSLLGAAPLEEIMGQVLSETGYARWLAGLDSEADLERLANVQELLSDAREFDRQHPEDGSLEAFLEQASLVSDIDDWELETDRVSLMTLHAAKGLEFPVAYIVALEQRFLPHERSKEDPEKLEEERRLLFVGITRAAEELQLSLARYRFIQGAMRMTVPSSFLLELPLAEMEVIEPPTGGARDETLALAAAPDAAEESWDQTLDEPSEFKDLSCSDTRSVTTLPRMMTAAEMLGQEPPPTASPELFQQGMMIQHPQHGLGRIVAVSGEGVKRSATVQFFDSPRQRRFVLVHSDLRPIRGVAQE